MLASDLIQLDLLNASKAVRARSVSPVELTRACLERIHLLDQRLNSFITPTAENALAEARQAEHEFAHGTTSAIAVSAPCIIHGISIGSRAAPRGRCAAAVAAPLCFGAVGSDTGGSNRIPAACCGVVGLKPTYGVVSVRGVVPVSTSFDHVGPLCHTVADTALMFRAMTDHRVAAEYNPEVPPHVSRLRIGVFRAPGKLCDNAPVEEQVQTAVDAAINVIRPLVAEVREAKFPIPNELGRLIDAEAYAFHASHLARTPERYDPRTRDTILTGQGISQAETARSASEPRPTSRGVAGCVLKRRHCDTPDAVRTAADNPRGNRSLRAPRVYVRV